MNFRNRMYYTNNRIVSHMLPAFFSVLIGSLALVLIGMAAFMFFLSGYARNTLDGLLLGGIENYGIVSMHDNWVEFFLAAVEQEEVGVLGTTNFAAFSKANFQERPEDEELFQMLLEKQGAIESSGTWNASGLLWMMQMNQSFLGACPFKLLEGNNPTEISVNSTKRALYLGYELRDIPVGTSFVTGGVEYVVEGILKKGSSWIDEEPFMAERGMPVFSYEIELDQLMVCVQPDTALRSIMLYAPAEGYSFEDTRLALERTARETEATIQTGPISEAIDTIEQTDWMAVRVLFPLCAFTVFSVIVIYLTLQLLMVLVRNREFGIWLANGMSRADIFFVLIAENAIKLLVALMIAVPFGRVIFNMERMSQMGLEHDIFYEILWTRCVPILLFAVILLTLASSAVSLAWIRKWTPVEFLAGKKDLGK